MTRSPTCCLGGFQLDRTLTNVFYPAIRHERQKGAGGAVAGLGAADDSDSDNRSDDSDDGGMGMMQVLQMEPAFVPLLDGLEI